jgi:hypothetical protein
MERMRRRRRFLGVPGSRERRTRLAPEGGPSARREKRKKRNDEQAKIGREEQGGTIGSGG